MNVTEATAVNCVIDWLIRDEVPVPNGLEIRLRLLANAAYRRLGTGVSATIVTERITWKGSAD